MTTYRQHLPQLDGAFFLTDGGIETSLIYLDGFDLPLFAAFHLLRDAAGREGLRNYFERYLKLALASGSGFILESATWRASRDWGDRLGYSAAELAESNRRAVDLLQELRAGHAGHSAPLVISGCVGPRGDGYDPGVIMTETEAERYHAAQIDVFAGTAADMVTAITMTNPPEAIGIVRAATSAGMPVAVSFTVETDGRLPTGDTLRAAVETVDDATDGVTAYYMINCAHPSHFAACLDDSPWSARVRGIRVNASRCSHAELDQATELDAGDPDELARECAALRARLPHMNVFGGCCGTDERHIERIDAECRRAA